MLSEETPVHIALIWAMARNRTIGAKNGLPWRLPEDMQFFTRTTMGKPVVMGRKTFESMKAPLVGRTNVVVTRRPRYRVPEGVLVFDSLTVALDTSVDIARRDGVDEVIVAGGAAVYRDALGVATRLYVTEVAADVEGDVHFPALDLSAWRPVWSEAHEADARHAYAFTISSYERAS